MPLRTIQIKPGVNSQLTQTANKTQWWASNLIRWQTGLLQKVGGWQRLIEDQAAGLIRAMHGYQDLSLTNNLLLGTDGGAQLYAGAGIYQFTYAIASVFATSITVGGVGVTTATVTTSFAHGASPGQTTTLRTLITLGGRRYNPGTTFTIDTTPTATTFTITLPDPTLTAASASMIGFLNVYGAAGTYDIIISLTAHGYSPGDVIPVSFGLNLNSPGTLVAYLPPGDYAVKTVPGPNTLTLDRTYQVGTSYPVGVYAYDNSLAIYGANVFAINMSINASSGPGTDSNWYLDNLGEVGLISATGQPIYAYQPPGGSNPLATLISTGPQINTGMFAAMPQAQIIAFGSEVGGVQDPMLVRWSDVSDIYDWTATTTNQAGSYRLSQGSRIVGGLQAPQTTLLWTDVGLWSMQYVGPPFVYSLYEIGRGCGLIAPKAAAILNASVYWMGQRQFYVFDGQSMRDMPCPVWDTVYDDLDTANISKAFAGANSAFNEVWFFYPSASGGTGEVDSYAKITIDGNARYWDTGRLARTTWIDQSVFGQALAGDLNRRIQQHDIGFDDDDEPMRGVFAESGFNDLDEGDTITFTNQVEPDMKWFGETPGSVAVTLKGVKYAQDSYFLVGPVGLDQANRYVRPRMRAQSVAVRIDWAPRRGFSARVGAWRFRVAPGGKRP